MNAPTLQDWRYAMDTLEKATVNSDWYALGKLHTHMLQIYNKAGAMRPATRDEKIVRPGVYEVPATPTDRDLFKQALEAWQTSSYGQPSHHKAMVLAMTALRERLSQPDSADCDGQCGNGAYCDACPRRSDECGCCHGTGWVTRDPDIGTDQECFVCDGAGTVEPARQDCAYPDCAYPCPDLPDCNDPFAHLSDDDVLAMQPSARQELQTCNCRWDGDTQVQQCTLHQAHVDAIHEWAERAKAAEQKLKARQEQEPVAVCNNCRGLGYRCEANGETIPCDLCHDKLCELLEGMAVSVDVSTGEHDAGHRLFGYVSEAMEDAAEKNGVVLLVNNLTANFTAMRWCRWSRRRRWQQRFSKRSTTELFIRLCVMFGLL